MKAFKLKFLTEQLRASYYFVNHPTRDDIIKLFETIWHKLNENAQEMTWDFMLLAYTAPEKPWLGMYKCVFGILDIQEIGVIDNVSV
jgi:hypothetical protein